MGPHGPRWGRGGGGTWINFCCWMCAAGLSEPLPLYSLFCANYRPHLSHFWANIKFSRSQLSHFLFLRIDPFFRLNEERFLFHLPYKHSNTFANRKYEKLSYPKKCGKVRPLYSQSSRENVTSSSGTSPLASYKEVPPGPHGHTKSV